MNNEYGRSTNITAHVSLTTASILKAAIEMTEWKCSKLGKTITSMRSIKLNEVVVLPNLQKWSG